MSFSTQDTIVAVATPPGRGGIGIVRLSGPDAHAVAQGLITHDGPLAASSCDLHEVRLSRTHQDSASPESVKSRTPSKVQTSDVAALTAADRVPVVSGFRPTCVDAIDQVVADVFPRPPLLHGQRHRQLSAHAVGDSAAIVTTAMRVARGSRSPASSRFGRFLNGRIDSHAG